MFNVCIFFINFSIVVFFNFNLIFVLRFKNFIHKHLIILKQKKQNKQANKREANKRIQIKFKQNKIKKKNVFYLEINLLDCRFYLSPNLAFTKSKMI